MSRALFGSNWQLAALLGCLLVPACMPCPGGITVRDNMSQDQAVHDVMACENVAHGAGALADSSASKGAKENAAFSKCMREYGYLSIPEAVLLGKNAPQGKPSCPKCSRVGALSPE